MESKNVNLISQLVEVQNRSTPSDKVYNAISVGTALFSAALILVFSIINVFSYDAASFYWTIVFYPTLLSLAASLWFSIFQLFRHPFLTSFFSLILDAVVLMFMIYIVIYIAITKDTLMIPIVSHIASPFF